ncbi:hypothetical protein A7W90_11550 [Clostridium sp. Bc-iso-3]|nr:hypothetical protein A7W90_11550 [Clostridium sp. Bc-iso-3]
MKAIFEWLTDGYTLFDNVLYNYIAMALVGFIAFAVAWNIVGSLYRNDIISGRTSGSILHWIIRLVVFIVLFSVVSLLIWVIRFIITVPLWIWLTLAGLLIMGVAIFCIIRNKLSNTESIDK